MKHFKVKETCLSPFCTFETNLLILHAIVLLSSSLWGFIIADHSKVGTSDMVLCCLFCCQSFGSVSFYDWSWYFYLGLSCWKAAFGEGNARSVSRMFTMSFVCLWFWLFPIKVWFWVQTLGFACSSSCFNANLLLSVLDTDIKILENVLLHRDLCNCLCMS